MAPQLGVFFREASQLRGRILGAVGLRIEYSVFNAITVTVIVLSAGIDAIIVMLVLTVGRIE